MARGSTGSRSTGRSPISGPMGSGSPINFGVDAETGESSAGIGTSTNAEGDREITGEGSIGGEFGGGGRNNSVNPAGASPFSPSSPKPPRTLDLIDLTKDAVSDLGKKKPPIRGGGIGVEGGASPAGNLGITATVPLGVSPFLGRGGVIIDPTTGQPVGGSVGLGAGWGPISITGDVGVDEGGCIQFVTVGIGPFSRTFQRNVCKPNEPPKPPTPSPSPSPTPTPTPIPTFEPNITYHVAIFEDTWTSWSKTYQNPFPPYTTVRDTVWSKPNQVTISGNRYLFTNIGGWTQTEKRSDKPNPTVVTIAPYDEVEFPNTIHNNPCIISPGNDLTFSNPSGGIVRSGYAGAKRVFMGKGGDLAWFFGTKTGQDAIKLESQTINSNGELVATSTRNRHVFKIPCEPEPAVPKLLFDPPLPNTPPRKNNMDDACCQYIAALVIAHGQNQSNLLGQPINEIAEPVGTPIFPFKIRRIITPKDPKDPQKTEEIEFTNFHQVTTYLLNQNINLDVALDPQAFTLIPNETQMMNPLYERPTDYTLKENKEPGQDKGGNDRVLKVGDKIFFPSVLTEQRYMFESLRRLEFLFPAGELADAQISKDLLMPGQEGELKIFNLIHAYEVLMQYLSAILGDPREKVVLKDGNPAKPGDQGVNFGHQSISHLIRELFKFSLDTAGDVDALMMMGLRDFRTNLANRIQIVQIAEIVEALLEDTGMLEKQQYIKLALEGDPYAGQYVEGKGFEPQPELDADTEEATEKILAKTLNNFTMKVKVSKRSPQEKADMRDLIVQLAKHFERQNAIPATEKAIQDKINNAEFGVALDMALVRQNVKAAASQSRPRTRKKGKK